MEEKRREIEMIDDEIDKNEELRQWSPMERKYYAKMDEAQALINNRDATPEDIKKSNQMFEELNKRHPEIDAVVGPVYDDRQHEVSTRDYHDRLSKMIRLPTISELPNGGYAVGGIGCNMAFRRSVILGMGGFNEGFIGNALREESELFLRLHNTKKKVYFEPKCGLVHLGDVTGGCESRSSRSVMQYVKFFYAYYYNHILFANSASKGKREWLKYIVGTVNTVAFYDVAKLKGIMRWGLHALIALTSFSGVILK